MLQLVISQSRADRKQVGPQAIVRCAFSVRRPQHPSEINLLYHRHQRRPILDTGTVLSPDGCIVSRWPCELPRTVPRITCCENMISICLSLVTCMCFVNMCLKIIYPIDEWCQVRRLTLVRNDYIPWFCSLASNASVDVWMMLWLIAQLQPYSGSKRSGSGTQFLEKHREASNSKHDDWQCVGHTVQLWVQVDEISVCICAYVFSPSCHISVIVVQASKKSAVVTFLFHIVDVICWSRLLHVCG